MADTVTPSGSNPYLALLQQEDKPPSLAQILQHVANLGFGMAGGLGQAASTGGSTLGGLGSGLILGNQINAQAAQRAEQERMKRLEWQFKAQEHEDQRAERLRKEKQLQTYLNMPPPGFHATPPQPQLMGPGGMPTPVTPQGGDYDTKLAGYEGGTKKGGMVFNELGSGAGGPYQIMPATWADIRAKNPDLNLPEVMPVDSRPETRAMHDAAHARFKAANAQGLQAAGFQPTPANLYLAHRFGLGGATSVLRADPNKPLAEVLPIDWQRQNPDMRGQTAGGFINLATERMGGSPAAAVPYVVRPDAKPVQYALMPDDVPFSLSSGDTTLPRPSTAQPTFTAPVMPQPTWEKPGDVVPVNPAGWFPQPAPPPAVPVPGGPPPAPGTPTGPGGPNVVQAQATPGPNTPPMVAGGGQPGGANPPPTFVPPARVPVPQEVVRHFKGLAAAGLISVGQAEKSIEDYGENLNKQVHETAREQYKAQVEIWKQREQVAVEERKIRAQIDAEQRAIAEANRKREESREQEGEWVRDPATGVETLVAKKDLKPGMVRLDKPAAPPQPGTAPGDVHILSEGVKSGKTDTQEYFAAWNRLSSTPIDIGGGQKMTPDMRAYPKPTFQAPGTQPSPQQGTQQGPQMGEGSKPLGEKSYTEAQAKDYTFATRIAHNLPLLEKMLTDDDGKTYSTARLPSSTERALMDNPAVPDSMLSAETKEFRRLSKDIVTAILRKESGANIPISEYPAEYAKYIPQPGDSEAEIRAKLASVRLVGRTIAEGSGRPLTAFGDTFNTSPGQPAAQGATTGTQPPVAGAPPQPKTKADFDKLPKGTLFLDPQGQQRVKP